MNPIPNDLTHHGIKGMKWGVRRTPEQLGHPATKKKIKFTFKTPSQRREAKYDKRDAKLNAKNEDLTRREALRRKEDDIKQREAQLREKSKTEQTQNRVKPSTLPKKKTVSDMSDDEIRAIPNRYNLEKQYDTMLSEMNKKNIPAGQRKVQEILSKAATQVATKAMTALVEEALKKTRRGGNNGGGGNS